VSRAVVVIGAGSSGTAAAYAARRAGARVTVVSERPGATALASGALDGADRATRSLGDARVEVRSFLGELGIWELVDEGCWVATSSGVLRSSRGRDRAVLDLSHVARGTIAVLGVARRGWDAAALAKAWMSDPWAFARGLRFEPIESDVLRRASEALLPDVDFAKCHDEAERKGWLVDRLRSSVALRDKSAIVMGPWLGLESDVAGGLSAALEKPVGEPLSPPGGIAGARFELARDKLLAKIGAERVSGSVRLVGADGLRGRPRVELDTELIVEGDAVVLAVGGLVGGGIAWEPEFGGAGFALSFAAPAVLAIGGERLSPSGSPHGALFERFAWSGERGRAGIERVGIWTDDKGQVRDAQGDAIAWLYAAGDAVADAPRTLLDAVRAGLAAGGAAALERG